MTVSELRELLERYDPGLPVVFDRRDHGYVVVDDAAVRQNVSRFEPPDDQSGPHEYVEVSKLAMAVVLIPSKWPSR